MIIIVAGLLVMIVAVAVYAIIRAVSSTEAVAALTARVRRLEERLPEPAQIQIWSPQWDPEAVEACR